MMKKIERLLEEKIIIAIMAVVILSIGVIKTTPIFANSLELAQNMQRLGIPSGYNDLKTGVCFTVIIIMLLAVYKCVMCMVDSMKMKRRPWNQELFEEDRNKRILVKFLFEEIEDGCPIPQEEELWALLLDMSAEQLAEALEQLQEQRYLYDEIKQKYCI